MGGRAVYCTGLENRRRRKASVGSNPSPSAFSSYTQCFLAWWSKLLTTQYDWDKPILGWIYTLFFVFLGGSAACFGHWLECCSAVDAEESSRLERLLFLLPPAREVTQQSARSNYHSASAHRLVADRRPEMAARPQRQCQYPGPKSQTRWAAK